jgi:hypothetical protein
LSAHQHQLHHHSRDFHQGQQSSQNLGINHSTLTNLSHTQLLSSRPSSTGHLTPNSGMGRYCTFVDPNSRISVILGSVTPTNLPSPSDLRHSSSVGAASLPDYESPNNGSQPKRPRISEGWTS